MMYFIMATDDCEEPVCGTNVTNQQQQLGVLTNLMNQSLNMSLILELQDLNYERPRYISRF